MEGDIMHDVAIKQGYEKQLVLVKSQVEALKQLANGQYDYALVAKIPALYWIQKNGWENLHISEQPLLSLEYCYAVPHGKNDLLARMSEGLSAIKATGEYREIYSRWLGVYEKPVFSLWEVLKYAFFIIVPIIIMLLGFVLWSWSLKGKVNRATAHLKDERQRLASIIAGTRAGTWEWNVQTGATRFNKEWAEMIGYTLEEITPVSIETWEKCVHPDDLQKCKDRLEEHFREDTDFYECEYRMKHKNGHWIWILDRGKVASRTNDEKPLWMFGTHLNITERMEAEAARNSINIQLEAQNNELEQVINVTSHDLRSPLVCIEGFSSVLGTSLEEILDILGKEKFSSETKEKLAPAFDRSRKSIDYISKSVAKMGLLLNGFLQVSRLGRVEIKTEELDMNALMSDVLSVFKFKSEEQGAKIEISDLPSCLGDEGQVNQLFTNLIANAFKYSASNRPGIIKISGQKEGNHIVYCVEDNGIGIAQEFQVKIFEMFHQLNPGTEGEGLGLCIVHKIAERHNGRAWVEAELGKGSRFYVSFPRA